MAQLVPFDQTVLGVVEDQDDDVELQAQRGVDFLVVHHEAAVTGDRDDLAVRIGQLAGNGTRQGDAHGGEAVGDDAGVRRFGLVHAADPHLVGTDVGDDDVLVVQDLAQVPQDLLRLDREALVVLVLGPFLLDHVHQFVDLRIRFALHLAGDALQRVVNVANDAAFQDVVLVDFGGAVVDMQDLLVAVRVPQLRVVFHHVDADTDDQIGHFETEGHVVLGFEADGAQRQAVAGRDHALGHEGGGHGDVEFFRELDHFLRRLGADDAVAHHDHGRLGILDVFGGRGALAARGDRLGGRLLFQRLHVRDLHVGDVFREVDEAAARLFVLGGLEGLAHDFRHDLRLQHLGGILGDRQEQVHQVEDLVAFLVQARGGALPGDGDHGSAVHVGIGNTGHQVGGTRTQGGHANAGAAGEAAVDVGHEGGALLVFYGDEFNGAVDQRVHHIDIFFTREAEDVFHTLVFQALYKQFTCLHQF